MTYVVDFDAYELHPKKMKKTSTTLIMLELYITHILGVHYYPKVDLYTFVNDFI